MKCQIPQISWHSRDPVLSIDFQPIQSNLYKLASGGTDSHVLIWYFTYQENKSVKIECASDLYRHNKSVNVVRFSPNGQSLASGDDEGAIFVWQLAERDHIEMPKDEEIVNKEEWYPVKLLRGHLEDIYDISWSKDSNFLVSASMDNTLIIWDMQKYVKIHLFSDFKGYVQGVTWDPINQFIASMGSDRTLRVHNINTKKTVCKVLKAPWTISTDKGNIKARLFYDDTFKSYFRRLSFTPDGEFLIVPSGIIDKGEKVRNATYIFSRHALNKPVITLPTEDKYTVAVRCNPFLYKLRSVHVDDDKENELSKPMIDLPYRIIFAVGACDSILMYDTEQLSPFAYISNIHYTHLTDLTWSPDGLTLVASSTDGYCSFIVFTQEELGEIYIPEDPKEITTAEENMEITKDEKVIDVQHLDTITSPAKVEVSEKCENIPITPKNLSQPRSKSPKPAIVQVDDKDDKDQTTTNLKVAKITSDKKNKKSPRMKSIKQFFVSPKTTGSAVSGSKNAKDDCVILSVVNKNNLNNSLVNNEKIDFNASKCNTEKLISNDKRNEHSTNVRNLVEENAMEVEKGISINITKENIEASLKDKTEVSIEKVESIKNINENALDAAISSEVIPNQVNIHNVLIEDSESDWKLELSQDERIVPMEMELHVPKTNDKVLPNKMKEVKEPESSKVIKESKEKIVPMEVVSSVPEKLDDISLNVIDRDNGKSKSPQNAETSKRRISFVTLSSKTSFKK